MLQSIMLHLKFNYATIFIIKCNMFGFSNYEISTKSQTEPCSNLFTSWTYDLNVTENSKFVQSETKFPRLTCYDSLTNLRAMINGFDINTVIFLIVIDPKNGDLIACFDTLTNDVLIQSSNNFTRC